ncbi:bZIP transcription factor 53 [Ziziphus jujuba]|uniref:BZIP transcription factor 53 n=1 Tax=Ziziphus jujuba TaxID=326968 RepID=A0A6P3ZTX9_ZIZJJ|nr:bZIP transcription factor 53 [Ziziphus jujuba]
MSPSVAASSSRGFDTKSPSVSVDEKKKRRMISNRESARRSRIRRQKRIVDLANEKALVAKRLVEGYKEYSAISKSHLTLQSENEILMSEKMRMVQYLKNMHLFLKYISENCVETKETTINRADLVCI